MRLSTLLWHFLIWVLYPLWLLAGLVDYLVHRQSHIESTSGRVESWLHVGQFLLLAAPLLLLSYLAPTPLVIALATVALALHTALSYADISYTQGRRYISPLEQHAHALLIVLPAVAVAIVVMIDWDVASSRDWTVRLRDSSGRDVTLLVSSFFLLAGLPIAEELIRCLRRFRYHQIEHDHQRDEGHDAERKP